MSEQDIINFGVVRGTDRQGYKIEVYGVLEGETEKLFLFKLPDDDKIKRYKKEYFTFERIEFKPQAS